MPAPTPETQARTDDTQDALLEGMASWQQRNGQLTDARGLAAYLAGYTERLRERHLAQERDRLLDLADLLSSPDDWNVPSVYPEVLREYANDPDKAAGLYEEDSND